MRKIIAFIAFILWASSAHAAATLVQSDTGGAGSGTSCSGLALGATATSGNTIVTFLAVDKNSGAITVPTGFTLINDEVMTDLSVAGAYKISTGTETTITWDWITTHSHACWAGEYSGLSASPLDVSVENNSVGAVVTSLSSGTTGTTAQNNELALAFMACDTDINCDASIAWSDSFTTVTTVLIYDTGSPSLSIAKRDLTATGTYSSTYSVTDTGDQMSGGISTFKEGTRRSMVVA